MAKKKPYRFFLYLLLRAGAGFIMMLPRSVVSSFARLGSRLAFKLVTRQRDKTIQHLTDAYGKQKPKEEIESLAKKVFEHFALTGVEILQFPKLNEEKMRQLVDIGNARQVYDDLLKEGKGLISMTAHIGNWELLAGSFGMLGYQGAVLARRLYYEPYNQWVVGLRQCLKVPTLYRDDASREILKRLSQGEIIGLLPDQDIDSLKGVFVPFFEQPAYTPVAPVRLALSSGAPMLPNFMIRTPEGRYQLILGEVIRPKVDTNREEAVKRYTAEWMAQFEKVIRQYPEQWAWMHNRWKTKPNPLASLRLKVKNKDNRYQPSRVDSDGARHPVPGTEGGLE